MFSPSTAGVVEEGILVEFVINPQQSQRDVEHNRNLFIRYVRKINNKTLISSIQSYTLTM